MLKTSRAFMSQVTQMLFEHLENAVFLVDCDEKDQFKYVQVNPAFESITGLSSATLIGQNPLELFGKKLGNELLDHYKRCVTNREKVVYQSSFDFSTGSKHWTTRLTPVVFEDGSCQIAGVINDITTLHQTKSDLQEQKRLLNERNKELNCLFQLSEIAQNKTNSLEIILQQTVDIIPEAFQYPQETFAQIILKDQRYTSREFQETTCFISSDITIHNQISGSVQVFLPDNLFSFDEGCPFLESEKKLIATISERIARIVERKKSEVSLQKSEEALQEQLKMLGKEKKRLEKANKVKDEFLSVMSHEMRTPLNGVIGFSEILSQTPLDTLQSTYLSTVLKSANELLEIVSNMLDLTKLRTGTVKLRDEMIDLKAFIKKVSQNIDEMIKEKNLKLIINCSEDLPKAIFTDKSRLRHILLALLKNAVKFTDTGSVTLSVQQKQFDPLTRKTTLIFSVADTGIGIQHEYLEKIMQPFFQVDMSNTRRYGGTGIGLCLVEELLAMLGSHVQVQSVYGKGSTFYFELETPCIQAKTVDERPESQPETNNPFDHKTILIAEDNQINRFLAKTILSSLSSTIQIIEGKDGEEACNLYLTHHPDIILMDIVMPKLNGYQATRKIRETDPQIPIIAMTAKAFDSDKEACLEAGMNDYVSKPINTDSLREILTLYL